MKFAKRFFAALLGAYAAVSLVSTQMSSDILAATADMLNEEPETAMVLTDNTYRQTNTSDTVQAEYCSVQVKSLGTNKRLVIIKSAQAEGEEAEVYETVVYRQEEGEVAQPALLGEEPAAEILAVP